MRSAASLCGEEYERNIVRVTVQDFMTRRLGLFEARRGSSFRLLVNAKATANHGKLKMLRNKVRR
jgi:hypothetical protein